MSVLSKTNLLINNIYIAKILRHIPEPIALSILNTVKRYRRNRALLNHKESFSRAKKEGKIRIVFILLTPQIWNSLKTVYEAAHKNENIEAFVVVSPYESKLSDGSIIKSYDYYKEQCPEAIEAVKNGIVFDVSTFNPDIIFRQSPYDQVFPKEYSMANLAKIAKTCYVPYNYNFAPNHLHIEYNDRLLADLYAVFSDCITNYNHCIREKKDWYPDLHAYFYSFPRFDIVRKMKKDRSNKITFTWVPRWNLDKVENDGTSFFDYKDKLIDFFNSNTDLQLIIRPHPNMFNNFVNSGVMSQVEVDEYLEKIKKLENVSMDDNMDYLRTFEKTDVLIADMSSINYEFYLTGRPIIYCGDPTHYNDETKTMYELMYTVSDWNELKYQIEEAIAGNDPNSELRKQDIVKAFNGLPDDIGKAIIDKCIDIARGKDNN